MIQETWVRFLGTLDPHPCGFAPHAAAGTRPAGGFASSDYANGVSPERSCRCYVAVRLLYGVKHRLTGRWVFEFKFGSGLKLTEITDTEASNP